MKETFSLIADRLSLEHCLFRIRDCDKNRVTVPFSEQTVFSCQLLGHKSQYSTNMRSCFLKLFLVTRS
ncbi:hypothetical protein DSH57_10290 [Enterococcus faecium]|nr:hypothetical protein [Enterococcus faecium]EGP5671998.1 hypothetical protein [Enterococcus faecium]EGP5698969.1 hypothetical protein [Enterococcus faecium]